MTSFVAWFTSSIVYGTVIMYGALGETLTQKSGQLNLGVPGMVYLGAFAGLPADLCMRRRRQARMSFCWS